MRQVESTDVSQWLIHGDVRTESGERHSRAFVLAIFIFISVCSGSALYERFARSLFYPLKVDR